MTVLVAVAFAGWVMTQPRQETWFFAPVPFSAPAFVAACGTLGLVWAATGAVLIALRPRNALGWLVLVVGVSQAWAVGLTAYGGYGLLQTSPGWAAYVGPALFIPGWLIPPTLLLALYPDGRLPGRGWRWPVAGGAVSIAVLTACIPFPVVRPEQTYGWAIVPAFPERLADVLMPSGPVYETRIFVSAAPEATAPVVWTWWPAWTTPAG